MLSGLHHSICHRMNWITIFEIHSRLCDDDDDATCVGFTHFFDHIRIQSAVYFFYLLLRFCISLQNLTKKKKRTHIGDSQQFQNVSNTIYLREKFIINYVRTEEFHTHTHTHKPDSSRYVFRNLKSAEFEIR